MIQTKHLGTYCLLFSKQQIVLVEKIRGPYTGLLDLPGGSIEYGEDIELALQREIYEEVGLKITDLMISSSVGLNYSFMKDNMPHNLFHIGIIYEAVLPESVPLQTIEKELDVKVGAWYDVNELSKLNLTPMVKLALNKSTYS